MSLFRRHQGKPSPKVSPAGWMPWPHTAEASATRRAVSCVTATTSIPRPSIRRATSALTLRRPATIKASETVPAEITQSKSRSSADMQASACGSSSTIAIRAEVSTAINLVGRPGHRGHPRFAQPRRRTMLWRRLLPSRRLARRAATSCLERSELEPGEQQSGHVGSGQCRHRLRHAGRVRSTEPLPGRSTLSFNENGPSISLNQDRFLGLVMSIR